MGRNIKEEEKTERAIRALTRLPENRRCINCDSLGPQYVCTTFWTFICTTCSGIHREFTHRVKSISMARFSLEEVSALQAAGNERARQIYFKGWDSGSRTLPDGSNVRRLRDFIKNVYVDRLYTGERGQISLPSVRMRLMEDQFGRKALAYASESRRSSSFDNKDMSSYSGRFSPLMKTYQGSFRGFFEERNPSSGHGSSHRETPRFEVVDYRFRDNVSGSGKSSSPRVQKDVGENSNAKARKELDSSSANQTVNMGSLIDFNQDVEPSGDAGSPSKEKEQVAPSAITLESLLFGYSGTDVVPSTSPEQTMLISSNQNSPEDVGAKDVLLQPCDTSNVDCDANARSSEEMQLAVVPLYPTSAASDSSFTPEVSSQQFKNSGSQPSHNVPSSVMAEQPSWAISTSGVDKSSAVQTNGGRKELPEDLFFSSYMPGAAVPGWQTGQWYNSMGFNQQPYHSHLMSTSANPNPSRSRNPFDDCSNEPCPAHPAAFSMASLQEALPMTSSLAPQQSPYYTSMDPSASMGQAAHTGVPPSRLRETGGIGDDIFGSLGETSRSITGGTLVRTQQNTSPIRGGNPFW